MALMPVEEARSRILARVRRMPPERVELPRRWPDPRRTGAGAAPPAAFRCFGHGRLCRAVERCRFRTVSLKVIGTSAAGNANGPSRRRCGRGGGAHLHRRTHAKRCRLRRHPGERGAAIRALHRRAAQRRGSPERQAGGGLDFAKGEAMIDPGVRLNARLIGLRLRQTHLRPGAEEAGGGASRHRRRAGASPGEKLGADQIVSSNSHALGRHGGAFRGGQSSISASSATRWPPPRRRSGARAMRTSSSPPAAPPSAIMTSCSRRMKNSGVKIDFWKIAMRPGKPFMYGRRNGQHVLGLPGISVSALVCARLFLKPLILDRLESGRRSGGSAVGITHEGK